jgi:hypothetical protein
MPDFGSRMAVATIPYSVLGRAEDLGSVEEGAIPGRAAVEVRDAELDVGDAGDFGHGAASEGSIEALRVNRGEFTPDCG